MLKLHYLHSFSKYLLSTCCMPGSMQGTGGAEVSKTKPLPTVCGGRQHTR